MKSIITIFHRSIMNMMIIYLLHLVAIAISFYLFDSKFIEMGDYSSCVVNKIDVIPSQKYRSFVEVNAEISFYADKQYITTNFKGFHSVLSIFSIDTNLKTYPIIYLKDDPNSVRFHFGYRGLTDPNEMDYTTFLNKYGNLFTVSSMTILIGIYSYKDVLFYLIVLFVSLYPIVVLWTVLVYYNKEIGTVLEKDKSRLYGIAVIILIILILYLSGYSRD